jgi:hypothetical protein
MFIFKHGKGILLILLFMLLASCTSLLFYPQKQLIRTPSDIGLTYENVKFKATDGTALHGWWLPAKGEIKGSVYFLHGNAENISTHIGSVYWLPEAGYNVFLLDYRGYGLSEGNPALPEIFQDIDAGMKWFNSKTQYTNQPRFMLAQSIGATLGIYYVATHPAESTSLAGLVVDAPLASYHQIAREKLASFWLTWPLQYPLSWLLPERYSPDRVISQISPLPLLMFASLDDQVIPYHHTQALFALAGEPKQLITTSGAHIATFSQASHREQLLHFFK